MKAQKIVIAAATVTICLMFPPVKYYIVGSKLVVMVYKILTSKTARKAA